MEIILNIITLLIVVYWVFLKSYFSKKGENLATKEDVGKITDEIEKVKQKYGEENELLKTNLNIFSSVIQEKNKSVKEAMMNFFDEYVNWINCSSELSSSNYTDDDYSYLTKNRQYMDDCFKKVNVCQERFNLFVENGELVQLARELVMQGIEYTGKVNRIFVDTSYQYKARDIVKENYKGEELKIKLEKYRDKEKQIHDQYSGERIDFFKGRRKLFNKFKEQLRKHMNELNKGVDINV